MLYKIQLFASESKGFWTKSGKWKIEGAGCGLKGIGHGLFGFFLDLSGLFSVNKEKSIPDNA